MLPPLSAYQEAVQHPAEAFSDPELKLAQVELDALGLPKPRSGNMAVVFRLQSPQGDWAVRCFERLQPQQQGRYYEISRYLNSRRLPYFVPFEFQERGILVMGRWQPIVKMAWAQGEHLDRYLSRHREDRGQLEALASAWLQMLRDLERHRIAHGDLQHGNVLIDEGRLRLVDYDGMFVPALAGQPALELGHPNYQHPQRSPVDFGPQLDRFSGWVVYLSLAALACEPGLWQQQDAGDECLLLRRSDFLDPKARTWRRLAALRRPGLTSLAQTLQDAAAGLPAEVPELPASLKFEDVLAEAAKAAPPRARPGLAAPRQPAAAPAQGWLPLWLQSERSSETAEPLLDAEAWVGGAAQWLLPGKVETPAPRARPSSLDRLIAGIWLLGATALSFGLSQKGLLALALLPWTALAVLLLYLRYRLLADVRQKAQLSRQAESLRQQGAAAAAALQMAHERRLTARAALARKVEKMGRERDRLADLESQRLARLRQDLDLDTFLPRITELRRAAVEEKERRLEELSLQALMRILQSHRIIDDPLLDIRRSAKLALLAEGISTAYDLQYLRDRLIVTRDGVEHYIAAIGPERASRIDAWHKGVLKAAQDALPARLPLAEERQLDLGLRTAIRDLRRRRRHALRQYVRAAAAARQEARRQAAALDAEAEAARRSLEAEEDHLTASTRTAKTALRQARWQEASSRQKLEGYQGIRFGRFLMALLPGVGRRQT